FSPQSHRGHRLFFGVKNIKHLRRDIFKGLFLHHRIDYLYYSLFPVFTPPKAFLCALCDSVVKKRIVSNDPPH
ncbi:MAG: hypothetical protein ACC669_08560, partial [bacterium]